MAQSLAGPTCPPLTPCTRGLQDADWSLGTGDRTSLREDARASVLGGPRGKTRGWPLTNGRRGAKS